MVKHVPTSNPTVVLLNESVDRSIVACARSLSKADIDFCICKITGEKSIPWEWTRFGNQVYENKIHRTDNTKMFKKDILELRQKFGELLIYPLGDNMIENLLDIRDWLEKNGIILPIPDRNVYRKFASKRALMNMCGEYRIKTPKEFDDFPNKEQTPFVAKPKTNFTPSGKKLQPEIIQTDKDYSDFKSNSDSNNYFFQEYVNGENCCLFIIMNESGEAIDYSHKVICQEPNGGSVIKAVPYDFPKIDVNRVAKMLEKEGYCGVIMFELIKDEEGEYKMIEANPRFWGPLQLCIDNGIQFPQYLYSMFTNEQTSYEGGEKTYGYKRFDGYISGIWKMLAGEGAFQTNQSNIGDFVVRDIWLRKDTIIISPIKIGSKALSPMLNHITR